MTGGERERLDREAEPFVRAIAARPADALPRLIYADWLDEHELAKEAAEQRQASAQLSRAQQTRGGSCEFCPAHGGGCIVCDS